MIAIWSWFTFYLVVHILLVVVAFGPTFAFPGISAMTRKDPGHAVAYVRVIEFIERRMTIPLAVLVPLAGVGLIYTAPGHIDLWKSEWLVISIVLYIAAFSFAVFVQSKNAARMLHLMQQMPAGPPPPGAEPPPEVVALGKRLQFGGMYLTASVVVILLLMVWQPGASYLG